MEQGTIIHTNGYRGPVTNMVFLEPGEYTVTNSFSVPLRTVKPKQAAYIVGIEMAWVVNEPAAVSEPDAAPKPEAEAEAVNAEEEVPAPYVDLALVELRTIASERGIAHSGKRKADLIADLIEDDATSA